MSRLSATRCGVLVLVTMAYLLCEHARAESKLDATYVISFVWHSCG